MAFAEIALAAQLLGSWWQSSQEKSAQNDALAYLMQQQAEENAWRQREWDWRNEYIKEERAFREKQLAPVRAGQQALLGQLGKASPLMKAEYRGSMQNLTVQEAAQEQASAGYAKRTGNVGGGRGEKWRLRALFNEAKGKTGLGYATAEQNRRMQIAQVLMGGGGAISGISIPGVGGGGGNYSGAIASILARPNTGFSSELATSLGWYGKGVEARRNAAAPMATAGTPPATTMVPTTVNPEEWNQYDLGAGLWNRRRKTRRTDLGTIFQSVL
jgi:hypothetical protein